MGNPIAGILGLTLCALLGAQELRMAVTEPARDLSPLMIELLADAGLDITVDALPNARATAMLRQGVYDGVFPLFSDSFAGDENLVPVPVPLFSIDYVAITLNPAIQATSIGELKPYSIGVVRTDIRAKGTIGEALLVEALDYDGLVRMFLAGRCDVAILPVETVKATPELARSRALFSPFRNSLYLVLHRRRQSLIPRIESTLRAWMADGRWQKRIESFLNPR